MSTATAHLLDELLGEVAALSTSLRQLSLQMDGATVLSLPMHEVLRLLELEPGLTVPQVARERGTSRQNSLTLVDRLSKAGLVDYVVNPDHQRSGRLLLTPAGKRLLSSANRRQRIWLDELLSFVTENELHSGIELLRRIRARLARNHRGNVKRIRRAEGHQSTRRASASTASDPRYVEPVEPVTIEASPPEELPFNLL